MSHTLGAVPSHASTLTPPAMEEEIPIVSPESSFGSSVVSPSAAAPVAAPAKGLLLRVKRRRNETPLETLLVSSERQEKRAALDDLRTAFAGSSIQSAGGDAKKGATATGNDKNSAAASPSMFRARPPTSTPTQRVFRLLTSTSAPKESHSLDSAIVARIASLRAKSLAPAHPALQPTAEEVHSEHILQANLSTAQKRQIALAQNRSKLASLQQSHLTPTGPQLVYDSRELQLSIVDVAVSSSRGGAAKFKSTFEPPPLTAAQARHAQKQQARESRTSMLESSHMGLTAGHRDPNSIVDPHHAAKQFTQAMAAIKRMPTTDRKQMDAYKGLLEDYLSTLPKQPEPTPTKPVAASQLGTPSMAQQAQGDSADVAASASSSVSSSSSSTKLAPKIPLRRKKPPSAPVTMDGDSNSVRVPEMVDVQAPIQINDINIPERILTSHTIEKPQPEARPTAGGVAYDPATLVPATGRSLHPGQGRADADADEEDDSEFVYDVYHLPDEATPTDATAASAPAGASGSAADDSEEYKSQYVGASSAYVVLKDGLMSWIGGGDELVNECDEGADGEDAEEQSAWALDEDENDVSDYPEDEDSSEQEDLMDDPYEYERESYEPQPPAGLNMWRLPTHQSAQGVMHIKKTAPKKHGFLPEEDEQDEEGDDDDAITRDVRRSMAAGDVDLSSDDEVGAHFNPQEQDDEDYADTIDAEEEMEYIRHENDSE